MSYTLTISGHPEHEEDGEEVEKAAKEAFDSMKKVGAYYAVVSGTDGKHQSFSKSFSKDDDKNG